MTRIAGLLSLLVLALLSRSQLRAQVSEEWVQRYNGSGNGYDAASAMVVDGSGNVYVTGYTATGVGYGYATIKYSTAGVQQWAAIYNGPKDSSNALAIAVDYAGNVYVTGSSKGSGTEEDCATLKYNSSGGEEWVARYDGPVNGRDYGTSIAVDSLGNVYVTGNSQAGASANNNDYVTIKYNSSGGEAWVARYHGPSVGNNYPSAVVVDSSGNVYVTGNSDGTISTGRDYATIKYNSSGVQLWAARYNYPVAGFDYATSLAVDDSGNVYVTGASQGDGPGFDYATIKYNHYGYPFWIKRYNGPGNNVDYAYSIKVDGAGNVYVTGTSVGSGTNNDYATIKYDPSGNQQWVARYDGPASGADVASSLAVDNVGNVYVTGWSGGSNIYNDYATVKYNPSGEQWWVQRYHGPDGNANDNANSIAIDDSGYVYVTGTSGASGTNNDYDYATIKYAKGGSVFQPSPFAKWISGTTNTIKWSDEGWTSVNIKCILNYGTPLETVDSVAYNLPNSINEYTWEIPDSLLSYQSKIIVENASDTTFYHESGIFRLKPYLLTKVNSDSTYQAYKKDVDRWSFQNIPQDVWPATWWQLFNYQGIDPYTGEQYSQTVGDSAFAKAGPGRFPDWESWVRAFSFGACYYPIIDTARYREIAVRKWYANTQPWNGSCFGIAASNALAFMHKQEFGNKFPSFPPFVNPISVGADTNVIKTVSELFAQQYGNPTMMKRTHYNPTPTQTVNDVKEMLREDNTPIKTLSFWNNGPGGGGHNVLPYELAPVPYQHSSYYIEIYDNAYPYSLQPVIIDTSSGGGRGTWSLHDWLGWGGDKWIMLEEDAGVYLGNAAVNKTAGTRKSVVGPGLEVYHSVGASMSIANALSETTGFINDTVYEGIPGSRALMVTNGSKTPPYGYYLPQDRYTVTMNNVKSDTAYAYFFTDYNSFFYERSGVQQAQTDNLVCDISSGGLSVSNPDSQSKSIKLSSVLTYPEEDYSFTLRSLALAPHDSVVMRFPEIVSYGSAKHYDVELERIFSWTPPRFICRNIPLPENTTHTYATDWIDITNDRMTVLVDVGNDGTIDDTLHLQNMLTDVRDHGSLPPGEYRLYHCYPNPFNPATTITYDVPKSSHVTLTVFNLLGQEVATLVDDQREAGTYAVRFDGSKLASGIYFCRLQAGGFTETGKLLLMK